MPSEKELEKTRKLIDQIAKVVNSQHHYFSEGEVRSIHKAYDWIAEANADLVRAETELKKVKGKKKP
jgi:hypothetical protein